MKPKYLKLIYDNATGIFSPFYRSESVIGSIEDFQSFKNHLADIKNIGGGYDWSEDVYAGINDAVKLDWKSPVQVI